jgi:hypothetical protein
MTQYLDLLITPAEGRLSAVLKHENGTWPMTEERCSLEKSALAFQTTSLKTVGYHFWRKLLLRSLQNSSEVFRTLSFSAHTRMAQALRLFARPLSSFGDSFVQHISYSASHQALDHRLRFCEAALAPQLLTVIINYGTLLFITCTGRACPSEAIEYQDSERVEARASLERNRDLCMCSEDHSRK